MHRAYESAREMELVTAAGERPPQTGCSCSPLGRMISRAIKGRNATRSREGRRSKKEMFDYTMAAYPPPQTYYVRPNARTITVTADNKHHHPVKPQQQYAHIAVLPPEPMRAYAAAAVHHPQPAAGAAGNPRKKKKKKKRVSFTPEAAGGGRPMSSILPHSNAPPTYAASHHAPTPPHAAGHAPMSHAAGHAAVSSTGGVVYYPSAGGAAKPYCQAAPPVVHGGGGHPQPQDRGGGYYGYVPRYAPSPLTTTMTTRWDAAGGTPRRHEYFSSEYRWCYPTPVRESIYSFATDANHRLSNVFSEENPNACAIV